MSVSGPAPSKRIPTTQKLRKAFKSSAFIPPEWQFANNADGVIGLITEVVMAVDRQQMFQSDQNAELRQHIHHNGGSQRARGLGQSNTQHRSTSRGQHGQRHKKHHHHRSGHEGSRGIQSGHQQHPAIHYDPGQHYSYQHEYYPYDGYQNNYQYNGYPNGSYPNNDYHYNGGMAGYDPRHSADYDHRHHQSRELQEEATSQVSILDDRHSVFSKETTRKRSLPRGTRAVTSDAPVATKCPRCKESVMTVIKRHTGGKNIAATAAVAAAGVAVNAPATLLPLALAVLDLGSLKRKAHHCPYCDYKMGKHVTITIPRE
ncbi:hypothetical protein IWW36_003743 [Coemansia brasiliensis]|uniref:LITAF domain-containing protein n=1 Tax=Coemansia brasiliensis TaxID=2650707 RepID=A0A9W8I4M2_9FUNG|nr:hypothetical protein IWW36_003743 [Coemansia brasiliensis]